MKTILTCILLLVFSAPLSAAEREVRLERSFGTLHGTLRIPTGGSRTAALLIAGSGPTDRNCNSAQGLYTDSFVYLARALENAGIASLRYDKRGIGASRYDDPEKIYEISFDDFIGDAAAWVAWLHDEGFDKVVLIGHSEGALIALCVAANAGKEDAATEKIPSESNLAADGVTTAAPDTASGPTDGPASAGTQPPEAAGTRTAARDDKTTNDETVRAAEKETGSAAEKETGSAAGGAPYSVESRANEGDTYRTTDDRIDGVVSLAGAGFSLDRLVIDQLSTKIDLGMLLRATEIFNSLRQGKTVENYPRELSMLFLPYLQKYWISQLKYDPQEVIRRVSVPILIVGGTNDIQVSMTHAEALRKAKPDASLLLIEGMTHPLKQSEGRDAEGQMAVYMDATLPLDTTLAEAVPRFILSL